MAIRVHHRTRRVDNAKAEMSSAVLEVYEKYELTAIEVLKCLNLIEADVLKYSLRIERHGDATKKGDEE